MMMMMSMPVAMAHHEVDHFGGPLNAEHGNKSDDGEDPNNGGGQEHLRNPHPPQGGGVKHGGGNCGDFC
jgi:hypothetical protein